MKLQNLLKQNKETITDYMNRAASYLRSMEQGAVTKDGYNLAEDLTVYEQEKLKEYIYCMAFDEMKKTVGRHCLNVCDFGSDREDFISNFQIVIMKRLKDFNANGSAKKDKRYEFLTYLKTPFRRSYARNVCWNERCVSSVGRKNPEGSNGCEKCYG